MLLYALSAVIGFLICKIFQPPMVSPFFQDVVMANIKLGKKVAISIDSDTTIFEMIDGRVRVTRGLTDFYGPEVIDVDSVDTSNAVQSSSTNQDVH